MLHLIRDLRLKRLSWQAIVDVLKAEHGVQINYRSVQAFFKRWVKRKALPMGWEIAPKPTLESANRPSLRQAPAELRQIREKEKGHRMANQRRSKPNHTMTGLVIGDHTCVSDLQNLIKKVAHPTAAPLKNASAISHQSLERATP